MHKLVRQREFGIVIAAIVLFLAFSLFSHGRFLSTHNWATILMSSSELGVVAVGVGFLMVTGEFDLSVGVNFAFSAMVMAKMLEQGSNSLLALCLALALGALIGLVNGAITVYLKIPSFVTTLGTWLFWSGILLVVSGGATITIQNPPLVMRLLGTPIAREFNSEILWWIAIAIGAGLLLHRSVFGNWAYAVGGKRLAARESGVPVVRTRMLAFVLTGVLAAFAGALQLSHLGSMSASYGSSYQLEAIAAAVVGGCALTGGRGSIFGVVTGTVILEMLSSGLILSGVSTYWYESAVGMIVILAVAMHTRISKGTTGGDE